MTLLAAVTAMLSAAAGVPAKETPKPRLGRVRTAEATAYCYGQVLMLANSGRSATRPATWDLSASSLSTLSAASG